MLIAINWLIFIWAVNNGHVVETSLGYYLNPLLNVLLAVVFLHEKPNRGQWLAIAIAGVAVLIIAIDYGRFPWVAISLAVSFGLYGLAKKKIKQDASVGLFSETAVVLPVALGYWIYLAVVGKATAWTLPAPMFFELLLSGVVTALPLLFFARACCSNVIVHTRLRTVYWADNHADPECVCVQGNGLASSACWFRSHLDSAYRIRYRIDTCYETR